MYSKCIRFKVLIILALFNLSIAKGQSNFVYNQTGLTPGFLVVSIDSIAKSALFDKTLNWVKETYQNPEKVIKTTIDNDKIRLEATSLNLFSYRSLGLFQVDLVYTIEISFRDGKYRFEPIEAKSNFNPQGCFQPNSYFIVDFLDGNRFYSDNGKLKCSNNFPQSFSDLLNSLNANLLAYLKSESKLKNDW